MTLSTPVYGLKYIAVGEPIRNTRQALEDNANTIEAALVRGGIAPPEAQDLATLSGRVTALEQDNAQPVALSAGYAQYANSPYGELVRCWKEGADRIRLVGMVSVVTAVAQGAAAVPFGTLPAGYAPPVTINRTAFYQSGTACRITLQANGTLSIVPAVALAAGQWFQLDSAFRTVNT